jgi:hypothetical protein
MVRHRDSLIRMGATPSLAARLAALGQRLGGLRAARQLRTAEAERLRQEFEAALEGLDPTWRRALLDALQLRPVSQQLQRLPGGKELAAWQRGKRLERGKRLDKGAQGDRPVRGGDVRGRDRAYEAQRRRRHVDLDFADREIAFRGGTPAASPRPNAMAHRLDDIVRARMRAAATDRTASSPPPPSPPAPEERHIAMWLDDEFSPPNLLRQGETHALHIRVGRAVAQSLVAGQDTAVDDDDVPDGGLLTTWLLTSPDVELRADDPAGDVAASRATGGGGWLARFELRIPRTGESATIRLLATPTVAGSVRLDASVYVKNDLYRRLTARIDVAEAVAAAGPVSPAFAIVDEPTTRLAHAGLDTTHEWTTPPGVLTLSILGRNAAVKGTVAGRTVQDVDDFVDWFGGDAVVRGRINAVRKSAEKFRARADRYLDDIDAADLLERLAAFSPQYDWESPTVSADSAPTAAWVRGYQLYDSFFPQTSAQRAWLDALVPGHRVNISWLRGSSDTWVFDVPWGLMYTAPPPAAGQPIDAMRFAGLRYRLGYTTHRQAGSKVLGALDQTHRGHVLYWDADDIGAESRWQRDVWAGWAGQVFMPRAAAADPKGDVVTLLDNPAPGPMPVLYLFCTCAVGTGNEPVLRFANSAQPSDSLTTTDLPLGALTDRPFVFANACTTLAADSYYANELAEIFFNRGCRAFLGTETKVPIRMASRFATVFFKFFYRSLDAQPMAAGEAVAQARLFLWTEYRNIGGLFYSLLNQYELFMATDAEIRALRA